MDTTFSLNNTKRQSINDFISKGIIKANADPTDGNVQQWFRHYFEPQVQLTDIGSVLTKFGSTAELYLNHRESGKPHLPSPHLKGKAGSRCVDLESNDINLPNSLKKIHTEYDTEILEKDTVHNIALVKTDEEDTKLNESGNIDNEAEYIIPDPCTDSDQTTMPLSVSDNIIEEMVKSETDETQKNKHSDNLNTGNILESHSGVKYYSSDIMAFEQHAIQEDNMEPCAEPERYQSITRSTQSGIKADGLDTSNQSILISTDVEKEIASEREAIAKTGIHTDNILGEQFVSYHGDERMANSKSCINVANQHGVVLLEDDEPDLGEMSLVIDERQAGEESHSINDESIRVSAEGMDYSIMNVTDNAAHFRKETKRLKSITTNSEDQVLGGMDGINSENNMDVSVNNVINIINSNTKKENTYISVKASVNCNSPTENNHNVGNKDKPYVGTDDVKSLKDSNTKHIKLKIIAENGLNTVQGILQNREKLFQGNSFAPRIVSTISINKLDFDENGVEHDDKACKRWKSVSVYDFDDNTDTDTKVLKRNNANKIKKGTLKAGMAKEKCKVRNHDKEKHVRFYRNGSKRKNRKKKSHKLSTSLKRNSNSKVEAVESEENISCEDCVTGNSSKSQKKRKLPVHIMDKHNHNDQGTLYSKPAKVVKPNSSPQSPDISSPERLVKEFTNYRCLINKYDTEQLDNTVKSKSSSLSKPYKQRVKDIPQSPEQGKTGNTGNRVKEDDLHSKPYGKWRVNNKDENDAASVSSMDLEDDNGKIILENGDPSQNLMMPPLIPLTAMSSDHDHIDSVTNPNSKPPELTTTTTTTTTNATTLLQTSSGHSVKSISNDEFVQVVEIFPKKNVVTFAVNMEDNQLSAPQIYIINQLKPTSRESVISQNPSPSSLATVPVLQSVTHSHSYPNIAPNPNPNILIPLQHEAKTITNSFKPTASITPMHYIMGSSNTQSVNDHSVQTISETATNVERLAMLNSTPDMPQCFRGDSTLSQPSFESLPLESINHENFNQLTNLVKYYKNLEYMLKKLVDLEEEKNKELNLISRRRQAAIHKLQEITTALKCAYMKGISPQDVPQHSATNSGLDQMESSLAAGADGLELNLSKQLSVEQGAHGESHRVIDSEISNKVNEVKCVNDLYERKQEGTKHNPIIEQNIMGQNHQNMDETVMLLNKKIPVINQDKHVHHQDKDMEKIIQIDDEGDEELDKEALLGCVDDSVQQTVKNVADASNEQQVFSAGSKDQITSNSNTEKNSATDKCITSESIDTPSECNNKEELVQASLNAAINVPTELSRLYKHNRKKLNSQQYKEFIESMRSVYQKDNPNNTELSKMDRPKQLQAGPAISIQHNNHNILAAHYFGRESQNAQSVIHEGTRVATSCHSSNSPGSPHITLSQSPQTIVISDKQHVIPPQSSSQANQYIGRDGHQHTFNYKGPQPRQYQHIPLMQKPQAHTGQLFPRNPTYIPGSNHQRNVATGRSAHSRDMHQYDAIPPHVLIQAPPNQQSLQPPQSVKHPQPAQHTQPVQHPQPPPHLQSVQHPQSAKQGKLEHPQLGQHPKSAQHPQSVQHSQPAHSQSEQFRQSVQHHLSVQNPQAMQHPQAVQHPQLVQVHQSVQHPQSVQYHQPGQHPETVQHPQSVQLHQSTHGQSQHFRQLEPRPQAVQHPELVKSLQVVQHPQSMQQPQSVDHHQSLQHLQFAQHPSYQHVRNRQSERYANHEHPSNMYQQISSNPPQPIQHVPRSVVLPQKNQVIHHQNIVKQIVPEASPLESHSNSSICNNYGAGHVNYSSDQQMTDQHQRHNEPTMNPRNNHSQVLTHNIPFGPVDNDIIMMKSSPQHHQQQNTSLINKHHYAEALAYDVKALNASLRCSNCGEAASFVCSGCKKVMYCSTECQNDAWTTHIEQCLQ